MTPARSRPHRPPRTAGFTLLELVIVLTITAMTAGMLAPVVTNSIDVRRLEVISQNLNILATQVERYYADTLVVPTALADLVSDPGVNGWSGPYVEEYYDASSRFAQDAFGTTLALTSAATTVTIASGGLDRTVGTADDIIVQANLQTVRRRITRQRVDIVNAAIQRYLGDRSSQVPALPFASAELFAVLVQEGYLENDPDLIIDGWGDPLVAYPKNAIWAISSAAVTSVNL